MRQLKEKLSALIITYNEIGYIERCLESVAFADEIIVVDSYSTDGTYEYLKAQPNVRVIQHPFQNFTTQKAYTLSLASHDWVLFIDADEVVPPSLRREIISTISGQTDKAAYWFYRRFMFRDQPLHFSGWQTDKNYRLFRKSKAKFSSKRLVHETLEINGESGVLKEKLIHYSFKSFDNYKGKMLQYGRLKAKEAFRNNKRFSYAKLIIKPFWRFFNNYFIRLGIFDGIKGINICYLGALEDLERYRELQRLERTTAYTSRPQPAKSGRIIEVPGLGS
ncbi:MAG: glycosyltransferase family 2 protein [Eudoraea sp.]|nr:glycosyltransferase family 2 protein [Eudoraea sp.]